MAVPASATVLDRLDRPFRDLRVSVTDRCNFRCPYCMPAAVFGEGYEFLPDGKILTFEEIERLARVFVDVGVRKVRITGGEPLLRSEISKLVALLARIEHLEDLTLTTNGYLLAEHAVALKDAGLNRITVSLDSLDDDVFNRMSGRDHGTRRVLEGIEAARKAGLCPVKINCVVQRGVNDHGIVDLARRFKVTGTIVRFIEYMDVGNANRWTVDGVVPAAEIIETIGAEMPLEPLDANYRGEVASRYGYRDGEGEIGVIASVTQPFCGDCTRVRVSTTGEMFMCLFADHGVDMCGPMRAGASNDELRGIISGVWAAREDRYSELRLARAGTDGPAVTSPKIEMFRIGG